MDKVSLAKKTAKLMVDKLSPQELENELYQLLIMLPDSDLDYVHDDVESGNIAGAPLINNPQDTEEYLSTSTYVEGDAFITEDKLEDVQEMLEKSLDKEVTYAEDKMSHLDSFYIFYIDLSNMLNSESAYAIMVAIDEDDSSKYAYSISKLETKNDDDDFLLEGSTKDFDKVLKALEKGVKQNKDEILNTPRYGDEDRDDLEYANTEESEDEYGLSDYDVVYRFDTPSPTIAAGLYEETFDEGDDIYIYDEQNDRYVQHEIINEVTDKDGEKIAFIVAPEVNFGPEGVLYTPFTSEQVMLIDRRKGDHPYLTTDYIYDDEFIDKIKSHPQVKDAYMDKMAGVVYIIFDIPQYDPTHRITVAATPDWDSVGYISVQTDVDIEGLTPEGEETIIDHFNFPSGQIYMGDDIDFIPDQLVYPTRENFYRKYYNRIDEIKDRAEETYNKNKITLI